MKNLHIHLVNYEIGIKDGILSKYTREIEQHLKKKYKVTVSNTPDSTAYLNHHINYLSYQHCPTTKNSVMITHFTEGREEKLKKVKEVMKVADYGVCFSESTAKWLATEGIPRKKLDFVNSATDIIRRPRLIAIMTDLYSDGRKREWMFIELVKKIDTKKFVFSIIGNGWKGILEDLVREYGLQVQWQPIYSKELGQSILSTTDYLLYMGNENSQSQSVIDAMMAGTRVIATDRECYKGLVIDHPFETQEALDAIFKKLEENRVADWTFENYAKKLVKIWKI